MKQLFLLTILLVNPVLSAASEEAKVPATDCREKVTKILYGTQSSMAQDIKRDHTDLVTSCVTEINDYLTNNSVTELDLSACLFNLHEETPTHIKLISELLKINKSLTSINLSGNDIGSTGACALAQALKENKTLTSINLSYNKLGNIGATFLSLVVKDSKTLTSVDLTANDIAPMGVGCLERALKANSHKIQLKY